MGIFVTLVVGSMALCLWLAVSTVAPAPSDDPRRAQLLRVISVIYDNAGPSTGLVLASLAVAVVAAAGIAYAEQLVTDRNRRSTDRIRHPLAPRTVMAATRGVYAGAVTVTVLVPAHDEEASLGRTLRSLADQTTPPQRVIVVADNCTDRTPEVARTHGADVVETVGNVHKKAGALNQVLRGMLDDLGDNDCVMVVDADTELEPQFIATAVRRLTDDRALMAVGGLFYGDEAKGFLARFQQNEYYRYSREIERRRGRVYVLTGTASIFRSRALRAVAAARGSVLPGVRGEVYDTAALTEDNELTLALKTLGAVMCSPAQCRVVTELMPTWGHLWNQRLRWQRGALENLGAYGFSPTLVRYWAQQLGIGYSVVALGAFWVLVLTTLFATTSWVWYPFWLGVGAIFVADRVVSVWEGGWRARGLACLLVPELVYDLFLNVVYVKGVVDITLDRRAEWGHVRHAARPAPVPSGARP